MAITRWRKHLLEEADEALGLEQPAQQRAALGLARVDEALRMQHTLEGAVAARLRHEIGHEVILIAAQQPPPPRGEHETQLSARGDALVGHPRLRLAALLSHLDGRSEAVGGPQRR